MTPALRHLVLVASLFLGLWPARAQDVPRADREALLARLAAIELQATVDRDFVGAEQALAVLEAEVAGKPAASLLEEPEWRALRGRVHAAIESARQGGQGELDGAVDEALRANDEITLETLGTRAAESMRRWLERQTSEAVQWDDVERRVRWLFRLDEQQIWEVLKDDPARLGSKFLTSLIDLVVNNMNWHAVPGRPPVATQPGWLDWLARALDLLAAEKADGSFATHTQGVFNNLFERLGRREALTPALSTAFAGALRQMDGYTVLSVLRGAGRSGNFWYPSQQPVLEAFIGDERAAVRLAAAERLAPADFSAGLRSRLRDPEVQVRLMLVRSLGSEQRRAGVWVGREIDPRDGSPVVRPRSTDPEARQLLATLARDESPLVREKVAETLRLGSEPADPDVYEFLASDADPLVRRHVAWMDPGDATLRATVMTRLAADADEQVFKAVYDSLMAAATSQKTSDSAGTDASWLRPTFETFLVNPRRKGWFHPSFLETRVLRNVAVDRAFASEDPELLKQIIESAIDTSNGRVENRGIVQTWTRYEGADLVRVVLKLADQNLTALHAFLAEVVRGVNRPDEATAALFERIAQDSARSLEVRLTAMAIAIRLPTEARRSDLMNILVLPELNQEPLEQQRHPFVSSMLESIPVSLRNGIIVEALSDSRIGRDLPWMIAGWFDPAQPEAESAARLIIDRFLDQDGLPFVARAVRSLGALPGDIDVYRLGRALHRESYSQDALGAMTRSRDARLLPLLRDALDPTWIHSGDVGGAGTVSSTAIEILQGFMSDEAAAILLDAAASSPRASVREQALLAVESIGRYRDALAAWQRRTIGTVDRQDAITRLVTIFRDRQQPTEARAEAVRGLGTLKAVEQLPLVIEALGDSEVSVREAASEALKRLNAPADAAGN